MNPRSHEHLVGRLVRFKTWIEPGPGDAPPSGPYTGFVERAYGSELYIRCTDPEYVDRAREFGRGEGWEADLDEFSCLVVLDAAIPATEVTPYAA